VAKKKQTPKQSPKPAPKSKPKSKPESEDKTVADKNQPQPGQQSPPKPVGGPADDTSVRAFADKCKELATDVMSGDYMGALKTAGGILSVASDLFGLPNIFGAEAGGEDDATAIDEAKKSLEECKGKAAAAPKAKGAADPNDPNAAGAVPIDLILQVILAILDAIRNRRKPPTPTP